MSGQESILEALRSAMVAKGLNSAALANAMEVDRKALRRALAGQQPLSLETFCKALAILELDAAALPWGAAPVSTMVAVGRRVLEQADESLTLDPYGVQGEQAFRLGFSLGIDFVFVADSTQLVDSGIPASVLENWPEELVLKLDAAFHRHNDPQFSPQGVGLRLSFDDLHDCFLPWSAITKVIFQLETPEPEKPEEAPEPSRGPGLRLVKG
jgi:transcriptional regulator with XRE-family HTH domain